MKIVYKNIDEIKEYKNNNKRHPKKQLDKIVASIKEFGFINPVLIDENNEILAGHGRRVAALKLNIENVPCIIIDNLTDAQKKAYRIADNRLADLGDYDIDALKLELENLKLDEFDIELTGFDLPEIDDIFAAVDGADANKVIEKSDPRDYMNLDKYYPETVGKYGMPIIKKINPDEIENLDLIGFNYVRTSDEYGKFVHFFLDDYQFYRVWNELEGNARLIQGFSGALSPDFSLYTDYPLSLQIYNTYRNRYCGAYWQSLGVKVIPTIGWSDERSFDFCFEGVEKGGVVAVGTVGIMNDENAKDLFLKGYNEMMKRLEPKKVIVYGNKFEGLTGDIIEIKPFSSKFKK